MAEGKRDLMDRQTAAVIGAGVSGLTAAYILQKKFDVTLFEADSRLGGHVDTRDVADLGPIDLGFLSYNEASHSSITRLFGELGVESRPANMSGDVVCSDCHFAVLALPPSGLSTVPARPDNVDDASWKRCVDDVARFGRDVLQSGEAGDPAQTLGAFLAAGSYSEYFVRHYIYPLIGGWHLAGPQDCDQMPIQWLISSMRDSGFFDPSASSKWRTISGGGRTYPKRIAARLTRVQTSTPVRAVSRRAEGVDIRDASGQEHQFDKAVIAVRPPQALRIMTDPTPAERAILGSFTYSALEAILHTDSSVLPDIKDPSSLIVVVSCATPLKSFSYMTDCHSIVNKTHGIDPVGRYIVSYNPLEAVDPSKVLARGFYEHPVFTPESYAAQGRLDEISDHVIAFAGSYYGDGYHEAGCRSGVLAAASLGVRWDSPGSGDSQATADAPDVT
jgi:uncharacterized protein